MKIKEILTQEELKNYKKWGISMNLDDIEYELQKHVEELEIKEFLLLRIKDKLTEIDNVLERKADQEGY